MDKINFYEKFGKNRILYVCVHTWHDISYVEFIRIHTSRLYTKTWVVSTKNSTYINSMLYKKNVHVHVTQSGVSVTLFPEHK